MKASGAASGSFWRLSRPIFPHLSSERLRKIGLKIYPNCLRFRLAPFHQRFRKSSMAWIHLPRVADMVALRTQGSNILKAQISSMDENFVAAVNALDEGDLVALKAIIDSFPTILLERGYLEEDYEFAYFRGATLLHHVAANPYRKPLPQNIVEIASLLIEAGADVNATTSNGATTIGLISTSRAASQTGVSKALINLLVARGGKLDLSNQAVELALADGARLAAKVLLENGAPMNLCFAAGIGDMNGARRFINDQGRLLPGARNGYRDELSDQEFLNEAFCFACAGDEKDAAKFLLKRGADIDWKARFWGGAGALHLAIFWDNLDLLGWLIEEGADVGIKHAQYNSTPLEWSEHLNKREAIRVLQGRTNRS